LKIFIQNRSNFIAFFVVLFAAASSQRQDFCLKKKKKKKEGESKSLDAFLIIAGFFPNYHSGINLDLQDNIKDKLSFYSVVGYC
jgi:hypothetical protein